MCPITRSPSRFGWRRVLVATRLLPWLLRCLTMQHARPLHLGVPWGDSFVKCFLSFSAFFGEFGDWLRMEAPR